ncbi:MAG: RNA polymerase sigma factor [Polyangiaceae bacterium]|nr:RNA polymerase sigma factor [Polyangiaceae bacterium]
MTAPEIHSVSSAIWRIESPKLIGMLVRMVRSVDLAEEIAQSTFVDALERWGESGVPDNPGAWLMTAARHRAIDILRHKRRAERKHEELAREIDTSVAADFDEAPDDVVGDDLLRLVFIACHPVLSQEARVALTLRLLGGLGTDEIARAFLVAEPNIAQRITRAKRTLAEKKVPFELPSTGDLTARLGSVLEVLYLIFNEGYSATAGDDWMRPDLCQDALRLGRILAELVPREPEVHGLVALMEIQASRAAARVGPNGEAVLLPDQDRAKWDWLLVRRGLEGLERAEALIEARPDAAAGQYVLQAAIAACHARAKSVEETNWKEIAALYAKLATVTPSPVVELNRAVAVGMAYGAEAGLEIADALGGDPALREYPFLPSVRADLLAKLGRFAEAKAEVERAAELTRNERDRALFVERSVDYGRKADAG